MVQEPLLHLASHKLTTLVTAQALRLVACLVGAWQPYRDVFRQFMSALLYNFKVVTMSQFLVRWYNAPSLIARS